MRDQVTLELLQPSDDPTLPAITLDPLPTGLVGGQLMEITGTVADGGNPEDADFGILSVVVSYSLDGGATWSVLGEAELFEGELWRYVWFLPQLSGDVDVRAEATNLRGNRDQTAGTTTIGTLLAIHGTVADSYGQPLENAAVVVTGGGLNVATLADNQGSFRFTSVADGLVTGTAYTLTASLDGRTTTRDGLVLTSDSPTLYPVLILDTSPPLTAASPAGGSYPAPQPVELFCSDDRSGCAVTHYTIDGSTPTTSSPLYAGPITVSDTTLQFFSIDQAGNVETVRTETYEVVSVDFADAPDSSIGAPWNYPTRLEDDGARHTIVPGLALGSGVDSELDGHPEPTAAGDDANGTDDEDGVFVPAPLRPAASGTLRIKSLSFGFLDAWLDWNLDGDWLDPGEQIFAGQPLEAGDNDLDLAVPETAVPGLTFARFRLSSTGGLGFDGSAADGEVEDHQIEILDTSCLPPATGDWLVTASCIFTGQATAPADVIVEPGVVLTIEAGAVLEIDLRNHKLLVREEGGVLVKKDGTLRQAGSGQP
ncbi:MAG: hypothetical protein GY856_25395 [bacterium]|nr:hypothetical protein [bacterium]